MPSRAHEVLIVALREQPRLLGRLVEKLTGTRLSRGAPVDATVRFVKTAEVKLDILYRRGRRDWTIVEVQRAVDPKKRRRWLLAASLLFDQTGTLGDLVVITPRADVARWARRVVHARAPLGTRILLEPVILLLGERAAGALLDGEHPELALFAAWAMQHRHGPKAQAIVERAIEVTDRLPRSLQESQLHAILSVLSKRMLAWLKERTMDADKIPLSPAARRFLLSLEAQGEARGRVEGLAEGEAKGRQDSLLTLLRARGLRPSRADEARILACNEVAKLHRWIERAATAASVREVLGAPARKTPARPARRKATSKSTSAGSAR